MVSLKNHLQASLKVLTLCDTNYGYGTAPTPSRHQRGHCSYRFNGRRFADDTFKRIFLNENVRISIKISLKFFPKDPINNNPALVQIMAWRRSGDKPLSEPMMLVYRRIYASLGLNELSADTNRDISLCCFLSSRHTCAGSDLWTPSWYALRSPWQSHRRRQLSGNIQGQRDNRLVRLSPWEGIYWMGIITYRNIYVQNISYIPPDICWGI